MTKSDLIRRSTFGVIFKITLHCMYPYKVICLGLRSKGWSQQGSFILPTISCQIRIHHHLLVSLGYLKSWLISKKLTFPTICWILKVKVQFNCFKHKYYKRELKLFNCSKELMKLCMIVSRFFHVWEEFHLTTIQ